MSTSVDTFEQVWLLDFEFHAPPGERPLPLCLVAREFQSGRLVRQWLEPNSPSAAPFAVGERSLFVAYLASAELGCFLSLDWPVPLRILDLYAEFRCLTNGLPVPCGNGLLGALAYYGIDLLGADEKRQMRDLAIRGGLYSADERLALLDYCQTDVDALAKLLPAMLPAIDLPRALLRGRYMAAVAQMEHNGVPIDEGTLNALRGNWEPVKHRLIADVDQDYGVYLPTHRRTVNPDTRLGQAILDGADQFEIDPYELADTVDYVWRQERESTRDFYKAKRTARQATGLTMARISRWEDSYKDHSTWPGLDLTARQIASQFPQLGLGTGYVSHTGYDKTDYAAQLWELMRDKRDRPRPRHDPDIVWQAAELVTSAGDAADHRQLSFSVTRFASWLEEQGIPWPYLESGTLDLSDEAFRQMARQHPVVAPLRELRHTLSQLRLNDLAVGSDHRNRCLLSPFLARTSRNQPSNSKFIFGPSCWLRSLIQPAEGRAVAYIDWEQQEFGIAAALSGDERMQESYLSGDPYLAFAKQAGAVPADATKETHPQQRGQFKVCSLAVQYGMGPGSLSESLGEPEIRGRELLRLHRQTYPAFWKWSQAAVSHAMLRGWLQTVFGWQIRVDQNANPRSLANFPMQANGAEMLRLACCLSAERGIQLCAPVHDALLIEAAADDIDAAVTETQQAMREASEVVLDGFPLRTDTEIVRHPDRYQDKRGEQLWNTVMRLLQEFPTMEVFASGRF